MTNGRGLTIAVVENDTWAGKDWKNGISSFPQSHAANSNKPAQTLCNRELRSPRNVGGELAITCTTCSNRLARGMKP